MECRDQPSTDSPDLPCSLSLRAVLDNAVEARDLLHSKEAIFHPMKIEHDIEHLRRQIEEQDKMEKLCVESSTLSQMAFEAKDTLNSSTIKTSIERRLEEYDAMAEQARKVLQTCESLKFSEE